MIVTVEISYYPLADNFSKPIDLFISKISSPDITVEPGKMSTVLTGDYQKVMAALQQAMGDLMTEYPSIFNIKISNSCPI